MLSIADLNILLPIATAFRVNFVDLLNAPASDFSPSIDPDGQYLTLKRCLVFLTPSPSHIL